LTKDVRAFAIIKGIFNLIKMENLENLETLVTIITEKNKTIEQLQKDLKANQESSMLWYKKYKELEESLTQKIEE